MSVLDNNGSVVPNKAEIIPVSIVTEIIFV